MLRVFGLLMALAACRSTPNTSDGGVPDANVATVPSASASVGPPPAQHKTEDEVFATTFAWNEALAARNAPALEKVYGHDVRLYDETVDRKTAVSRKAVAFKGTPDYTQAISSLTFDGSNPQRLTMEFIKTWHAKGKDRKVRSVLVFELDEDGHARIVEESDLSTDARRLAKLDSEGCWGLVHEVVLSTPSGRGYRGNRVGTVVACDPTSCGTFQIYGVAFGKDEMERQAFFDVDQRTGEVHRGAPGGPTEPADPAIVAKMKTACALEYLPDGGLREPK